MYISCFDDDDYPVLDKWCQQLGQATPPLAILPFGVVARNIETEEIYGFAFMYQSMYTPVAVIEWVFVNPEIRAKLKHKAINMMYDMLIQVAQDKHKIFIMTATPFHGIAKMLNKKDFMIVENGFTHMLKIAKEG